MHSFKGGTYRHTEVYAIKALNTFLLQGGVH
jgi:hypothetical protein